jgi:hypothetical protein
VLQPFGAVAVTVYVPDPVTFRLPRSQPFDQRYVYAGLNSYAASATRPIMPLPQTSTTPFACETTVASPSP